TTGDAPDLARGADRQHAAVANRDSARARDGGIERHDPRVLEDAGAVRQSDDGSGFASLSFISWSQQVRSPPPGLLHSTSAPHESQRYRLPSWVDMLAWLADSRAVAQEGGFDRLVAAMRAASSRLVRP